MFNQLAFILAEIIRLQPVNKKIGKGNFYFFGDEPRDRINGCQDTWNSTNGFRQVSPLKDKHQIFVCSETNELLLFVPSLEHTENVFPMNKNKMLIKNLVQSVSKKPNIAKSLKNSEERKGRLSN